MVSLATKRLVQVAAIVLFVAGVASANQWQELGPHGGTIQSIAFDPAQPSTVYAGVNSAGVFKSTDGGATWVKVLPLDSNIEALLVSWADSDTVYCGSSGGIRISENAGQTWTLSNTGLGNVKVRDITQHPIDADTVVVGTSQGVYGSTNGGAVWQDLSNEITGANVNVVILDPVTPSIGYAATTNGIFKSTNSGANWTAASFGLSDTLIRDLIIDPSQPNVLYAATNSNGVFKSINGAASWAAAGSGGPNQSFRLAIDPASSNLIWVGSQGRGTYHSSDGGLTWSVYSDDLPPRTTAYALAFETTIDTLYSGLSKHGLYQRHISADAWNESNSGIRGHEVSSLLLIQDSALIYAGISTSGPSVFRAPLGTSGWVMSNSGINYPPVYDIIRDPNDPMILFTGNAGAIFRSINGGDSWENASTGMPTGGVRGYVLLAIDSQILYAGTRDGIWKTTDGADSWNQVGMAGIRVYSLAIGGASGTEIFAGTLANGVYASLDDGATWGPVNTGLVPNVTVYALLVDPAAGNVIYAGLGGGGVFKTTDSAANWQQTGKTSGIIQALTMIPGSIASIVAGSQNNGVFISTDGGASWKSEGAGLPDDVEINAFVNDVANQCLFAGTDAGVFILCKPDVIFSDNFESGQLTAWSEIVN